MALLIEYIELTPKQGGQRVYTGDKTDALLNATEVFTRTVTDPKAQVIMTLEGLATGAVGLTPVALLFYDGPDPGDSFSMFNGIIPVSSGTLKQPFSNFVTAQATQLIQNNRGTSHTVSVSAVTLPLLDAIKTEVQVRSCFRTVSARLTNHVPEPHCPNDLTQWLAGKWGY